MMTYDFAPLLRTAIGFERLARQAEAAARFEDASAYPPYNIETAGEDHYRITLAVAGFTSGELEIETRDNQLAVTGHKAEKEGESSQYLHKGIASRGFTRRFSLADHVRVSGANLADGLLTIDLVREIPEAKKPRRIDIKGEAPASLLAKVKHLIESPTHKDAA
jgi:molecular chaperone IbpA